MPSHCMLRHCPQNKVGASKENKFFHRFPKNPQQFKLWEDWVLKNQVGCVSKITSYHRLCSDHFTKESYRPFPKDWLKTTAVPSIAPEVTADIAFRWGVVSKREDFQPLLLEANADVEGQHGGTSSSSEDGFPLEEVADVREDTNAKRPVITEEGDEMRGFQIHKRRRLDYANDALPCTAEKDKTQCSPSAERGEGMIPSEGSGSPPRRTSLNTEGNAMSEDDSLISEDNSSSSEGDSSSSEGDSSMSERDTSRGDVDTSSGDVDTSMGDASTPLGIGDQGATPVVSKRRRMKRKGRLAFLGDITPGKLSTPRSRAKALKVIRRNNERVRKDRHDMKRQLRRARKKITDLKSLLKCLTSDGKLPLEVARLIEDKFAGPAAGVLKNIIIGRRPAKYDDITRQFALTLNFHSPAAYKYVRQVLKNYLPDPRTLSKWYAAINGKPGFTEEAKAAIKCQADIMRAQGHTLRLSLTHDDMAIRQQTTYNNDGTVSGFADDGSGVCGGAVAKQAWVFMAVAINASWKIAVGYFFIDSMGAMARKNLVKRCLEFLHETGAKVESITFDGLKANISTVEALGAVLQPGPAWKPYFPHPVENEPLVYVILDAAHMLKLWRNVFGGSVQLQDSQGRAISFYYIKKLHDLQEKEGLRAGNKLSKRHVNFDKNKMKVFLATQVLSTSVADAIDCCRDDWDLPEFRGSEGTVQFIRIADSVFDILNSSSFRSSNPLKKALNSKNISLVREKMEAARQYICGLKAKGQNVSVFTPVLDTPWYTGFLGFLVDMASVDALYDRLVGGGILQFLPTYKLSQDHLEMWFGCVRARGGWNNNPSTTQFVAAYKRLLTNVQLTAVSAGSNCWPLETVAISNVSSKPPVTAQMKAADEHLIQETDHSYARTLARTGVSLSTFVGDVVEYIAGFVVRKVSVQHACDECSRVLFSGTSSGLVMRKDRGGLKSPSGEVLQICRKAESLIRASANDRTFLTTKRDVHVARIFREVMGDHPKMFGALDDHISDQAPLENHKFRLVKLIITKFLVVRMCWDVKKLNNSFIKERLRARATKTVLFQHQ